MKMLFWRPGSIWNYHIYLWIIVFIFTASYFVSAQESHRNPTPNEIIEHYSMPVNPGLELMRHSNDYVDKPMRIDSYRSSDGEEWILNWYRLILYTQPAPRTERLTLKNFDNAGQFENAYILEREYGKDGQIRRHSKWKINEDGDVDKLISHKKVTYENDTVLVEISDDESLENVYYLIYDDAGRLYRYRNESFDTSTESWKLSWDIIYTYEGTQIMRYEDRDSGAVSTLTYGENSIHIDKKSFSEHLTQNDMGQVIEEHSVTPNGQADGWFDYYTYDSEGRISNILWFEYMERRDGSRSYGPYGKKVFHYAP